MNGEAKAEREKRQTAYALVFAALIFVGLGLYGIWLQGPFWDHCIDLLVVADQITQEEVVQSFALPSIVTSLGGLLVAWLILSSKLTEKLTVKKKNVIFLIFAILYAVVIFIPAKVAGERLFGKARAAMDKFNKGSNGRTQTQR